MIKKLMSFCDDVIKDSLGSEVKELQEENAKLKNICPPLSRSAYKSACV